MSAEPWLILGGATGAGLLAYAARILLASGARPLTGRVASGERRSLAEVSVLWTGRQEVVHFRDIARLWRQAPAVESAPMRPRPNFRHPEIDAFFAEWVERPSVRGEKRAVIEKVLALLDREGDCPSVVRKTAGEAESRLDKDVFARLATIPLWQHTLTVARTMAKKVRQEIMLPDALIAALGHDLGKIPAHLETLYRTGDHPLISLIILTRLPEFESMPNREEIGEAIRQHHLLKADSPLAVALKDADRQVRLEEISRLTQTPEAPAESRGGESMDANLTPSHQATPMPAQGEQTKTQEAPAAAADAGYGDSRTICQSAWQIPGWFDSEAILSALKGKINLVIGGRWSVISSPDGLVFAQQEAFWEVVKKIAGQDPAVLAADGDDTARREILLGVVNELARQRKGIATEFVADGYYTTQCIIVMESGRTLQVPLVPFRAEAFGLLPSTLEATKLEKLKRMVKTIKPKQVHGGGGQCGVFD